MPSETNNAKVVADDSSIKEQAKLLDVLKQQDIADRTTGPVR